MNEKKKYYTNVNYIIIIINYIFISINAYIKKIIIRILIRELRSKIYYFNKFSIIIFYIKKLLFNNIRVFT